MRDSVPSGSYSSVCNVLRQWQSRSSLLIESTDSMIYGFSACNIKGTVWRHAINDCYKTAYVLYLHLFYSY